MGQLCREIEKTVYEKIQKPVKEWVRQRRQRCRSRRRWWQRLFCWFVTILVQIIVFIFVTVPTKIIVWDCILITILIPSAISGIVLSIKRWEIKRKKKFPYNKEGWKKCFSDEFNSKTLDTTKWTPLYGAKATERFSFEDIDKIIDNEPGFPKEFYFERNIELTGNSLKLWSTRERNTYTIEPWQIPWMTGDPVVEQQLNGKVLTSDFTGAWMSTHGKASVCIPKKHGYFEVRAKNPDSWGFWTAFWLTADNHLFPTLPFAPWPPEIDVFEFWTNENRRHKPGIHVSPVNPPVHKNDDRTENINRHITMGNNSGKNFNIYGCEWNENEITFYINHIKIKKVITKKVNEFIYPMGLILDIRVDTNWVHKAKFPNCLEIDYVRVYEKI